MEEIEFTEDGTFKWMEEEIAHANARADGVKLNPDVLQALINEVRKLRTEVAVLSTGTPDDEGWSPSDWLHGDETGSVHRWMEIEMERMRRESGQPAPQAWTPALGQWARVKSEATDAILRRGQTGRVIGRYIGFADVAFKGRDVVNIPIEELEPGEWTPDTD